MMAALVLGLLLFTGLHLYPAAAPAQFEALRGRVGVNGAKGIVALGVLAGLALIVFGWRASPPAWVYAPPPVLRGPAMLLIALGIWLFVLSTRPSVLRRILRHPQLLGVFLWAVAHLMLNGESRSLVLFGTLAAWCVLEIVLINRRDGGYAPPAAPPVSTDIVTAVLAVVAIVALAYAHPWLAGVAVM